MHDKEFGEKGILGQPPIVFKIKFLEINLVGCCFSSGFQSTIVNQQSSILEVMDVNSYGPLLAAQEKTEISASPGESHLYLYDLRRVSYAYRGPPCAKTAGDIIVCVSLSKVPPAHFVYGLGYPLKWKKLSVMGVAR